MISALPIAAAAAFVGFLAGRLFEARVHERSLHRMEPLTARDLTRLVHGSAWHRHAGRLSERAIEAAIVAVVLILVAPLVFVALHQLFAPLYPRVGKIEMRVVPNSVAEARR